MTELRMPHSIIAKEIKVPLIAFGQVVQFFSPRPFFFVIKVVSNINNHTCICTQGSHTRTCVHAIKICGGKKAVFKVRGSFAYVFQPCQHWPHHIDPVKYAKSRNAIN